MAKCICNLKRFEGQDEFRNKLRFYQSRVKLGIRSIKQAQVAELVDALA